MHVGHLGGRGFFDLTVLGAPVNLAARLEAETKTQGVELLMDETTYALAGRPNQMIAFPKVTLRGVPKPVNLWGWSG